MTFLYWWGVDMHARRRMCAPHGVTPKPRIQVYDLLAKLAATVLVPFAIGKVSRQRGGWAWGWG